MRYFLTSNATRGYYAGGFSFTFEPTALERGSWHGVLATDGQSADALAAAAFPQVSEITEEQFNDKKKGQQPSASRRSAPVLPKSSLVRGVAAAVAAVATTSKSDDPVPVAPKSSGGLRVTKAVPPEEPLLVSVPRTRSTKK